MVENLGNAAETTTSITWTAPSWGGSPSIHDANGQELFSISLAPGEAKVLFAHLPAPASASFGSSTQTTLTLCMGSGEEALCESMPFTFTAQNSSQNPPIIAHCQIQHSHGQLLALPQHLELLLEHEHHGHDPAQLDMDGHR